MLKVHTVDIPVTVKNEDGTDKDYGTFKARIRDYETSLLIELKTDALIVERKASPDEVGSATRTFFTLLATFSITCDKTPDDFDVEAMMTGDPGESLSFLMAYVGGLREAEARFREGDKKTTRAK